MKLFQVTMAIAMIALCCSLPTKTRKTYGIKHTRNYGYEEAKGGRYYYGGKYNGKCGLDGLYYKDDYSFVFCSNGNNYVQPCAPGTRNSGYNRFTPGQYYAYSNFCDVNLVDYGYVHNAHPYNQHYDHKPVYDGEGYGQENYHRRSSYGSEGYDRKGYQPAGYGSDGKYKESHRYESAQKYEAPHSYGSDEKYEVTQGYKSDEKYQQPSYGYRSDEKYDVPHHQYDEKKYDVHVPYGYNDEKKYEEKHGYESKAEYEETAKYESNDKYDAPVPQKYDVPASYGKDVEKKSYGVKVASAKVRGYKQEANYEHKEGYQTRNTRGYKKPNYHH